MKLLVLILVLFNLCGCIATRACADAGVRQLQITPIEIVDSDVPNEVALLCDVRVVAASDHTVLSRNKKIAYISKADFDETLNNPGRYSAVTKLIPPSDIFADFNKADIPKSLGRAPEHMNVTSFNFMTSWGAGIKILLPAAFAFDFITFPIQAVFIICNAPHC